MSVVYPIQALVIGLLLMELLRHRARDLDLLDRPNHRKLHAGEVPLIGGIGIFGAVVLSTAAVPGLGVEYAFLFLPALLLMAIGLADDARDLKATTKLAGQIGVAVLVLALNPGLLLALDPAEAGSLFWEILSWVLTVIVLVGAMNAFNMMDGIDGLAGAVSSTALGWIALAATASGQPIITMMALQLLMPVLAFLYFNARAPWRPRAVIFLGDAGSLLLGFCITVLGLQLAGPSKSHWSALALAFLIALPAMDTVSLIFRRALAGRSPLSADREHLHHLLQRAGLSAGQVAGFLTLVSVLLGVLGLTLDFLRVGSLALVGVLLGLFLAHTGLVIHLRRRIAAGTTRDTALDDAAAADTARGEAAKWPPPANTSAAKVKG
jgi:UDP-GlcNAc:undecaprenyl-phosphate/decaprenyl-phosphate GlcNAc-1-phosphate transferase